MSQPAKGSVFDYIGKIFKLHDPFEPFQGFMSALVYGPAGDIFHDFMHATGAFTAGDAFTAAFTLQEVGKELCDVHHAGIFIHYYQSSRAHDGTCFEQGFVVNQYIQAFLRQATA